MIVNVTSEDFNNGIRGSNYKCPVALAIRRAIGHDLVSIGVAKAFIFNQEIDLPIEIQNRITDFDKNHTKEAFSFRLAL